MIFLYFLLVLIIAGAIAFAVWFIKYRQSGKCPVCLLEKIFTNPAKITMDISNEEDYSNGAALTPPMGWSSWNTFRQNINEDLILETAAAMKITGLLDAGYNFVNLDDCWQSSMRDNNGNLQNDLERFPNGISALARKLNSQGFKLGIYSSNGTLTCEDLPASLGNEYRDAKTFAGWGCEFFKYDFCHHKIISGDTPVIEKLEISRPRQSSELTLNPEDAELFGKAAVVDVKALPSGKGIGRINHGAGKAVFTPVVNFDGIYVLTIIYNKFAAKTESYLQVTVNGELYEVFFPETKAFSATGRVQLMIKLQGGSNEIVLENPVKTMADSSFIQYRRMGRALKKASADYASEHGTAEKPITYSICEWGKAYPWYWGAKAGNMWRTTGDIFAKWISVNAIYERTIALYEYAGPGHWNDPDMLEVGNGDLTEDENKTHFSLWCMMAAPLVLGNDIRKFISTDGKPNLDNPTLKIVTNKSLILIDQDPLGKAAKRIRKEHGIDIIARPLSNGDIAVCFYNKTTRDKGFSYDISEIAKDAYLNFNTHQTSFAVHELWSDERFTTKTISATLPKHGCKVFRISRQ